VQLAEDVRRGEKAQRSNRLVLSGNDAVVEGDADFTCKRYAALEDAAVRMAPEAQSTPILWCCFTKAGQVFQNSASHTCVIHAFSVRGHFSYESVAGLSGFWNVRHGRKGNDLGSRCPAVYRDFLACFQCAFAALAAILERSLGGLWERLLRRRVLTSALSYIKDGAKRGNGWRPNSRRSSPMADQGESWPSPSPGAPW
jgi:hypothetical protein